MTASPGAATKAFPVLQSASPRKHAILQAPGGLLQGPPTETSHREHRSGRQGGFGQGGEHVQALFLRSWLKRPPPPTIMGKDAQPRRQTLKPMRTHTAENRDPRSRLLPARAGQYLAASPLPVATCLFSAATAASLPLLGVHLLQEGHPLEFFALQVIAPGWTVLAGFALADSLFPSLRNTASRPASSR